MGNSAALHLSPPREVAQHRRPAASPHRTQSPGHAARPELRAYGHGARGRRPHLIGGRDRTSHLTIAGRGVMVLDGDRIEVSANDLVHIPAGVPYGMHTLGGIDWVYVVLQAPIE